MRCLPTLCLLVILVQLAISAMFPIRTKSGETCGNNVAGCNLGKDEQCCTAGQCDYNGIMSFIPLFKPCTASSATCDFKIDNVLQAHPCYYTPTQNGLSFLTNMKSAQCDKFKAYSYGETLFYSEALFENLGIQYTLKEDDTNKKSWIYFTALTLSLTSCSDSLSFSSLSGLGSYFTSFTLEKINIQKNINEIIKFIPSSVTTIYITSPNIYGVLDLSQIKSTVTSLTITGTSITDIQNTNNFPNLKILDLHNNKIRCNVKNSGCKTIADIARSSSVIVKIYDNHFYGYYNPATSNCLYAYGNCLSSSCSSLGHKALAGYEDTDSFDKCFCREFTDDQGCNAFTGCEFKSSSCKNVNYCKSKKTAEACFQGTDCGWCGHNCTDISSSCPDCNTYDNFCNMGSSSNYDVQLLPLRPSRSPYGGTNVNINGYKSIDDKYKCRQNRLGDGTHNSVECYGDSSTKSCTDYFSNCESLGCIRCSESNMCYYNSTEQGKCQSCASKNTQSECNSASDCKWWSQTEIVFERSLCTSSSSCTWDNTNNFGKRVHSFCENKNANGFDCIYVNDSSPANEQSFCKITCHSDDNSKQLRFNEKYNKGSCVWCGSYFAAEYEKCPDCIGYTDEDICKRSHDTISNTTTCFWCGNGACRSKSDYCPNCDSYKPNNCNGATRCKLCSVQGFCINNNEQCKSLGSEVINNLKQLVNSIDEENINFDDPQQYCKLETDSVTVLCNQEYTKIQKLTLHGNKIELSKLTPLTSIPVDEIVIKDASLKTNTVSQILSLINRNSLPTSLTISGLGLSGNLTYNTDYGVILDALNYLDISNNSLNGTVPNSFKLIPTLILSGNLLSGTIDNCNRIANNCFVDPNCDWKSNLNPKCDCSQFTLNEVSCKTIPFCSYEEGTYTEEGKTYDVHYCVNKAIDTSENKLPTYAYALIGVAAAIVVIAIIVVAVLLTKRKSSYSSSSSSSNVFEAELDSKTGAEVTF